jgi:glycosyltransferase involved in cell wall biosynthesis
MGYSLEATRCSFRRSGEKIDAARGSIDPVGPVGRKCQKPPRMTIGYLVNQYPASSHTFIRRELRALEALGFRVERYTVRRSREALVDPLDLAELEKTHCILEVGPPRMLLAALAALLRRPAGLCSAVRLCLRLGANSPSGRLFQLVYLLEACVLLSLTRRHGVTHIHAHFGTNSTTVAMLCRRLGGPTYSFMVHGPDEFERPRAVSLTEKVHEAEFVTAISQFCQSQVFRWSGLDDWSKVHIVPCGVDQAFSQTEPAPVPSARRLLWVGRMAEEKGLPVLLEACRSLREQGVDFQLVLAGDGHLRTTVEERIAQYRLQPHVRLAGWLDDGAIRREIEASRALVVASFAEGLPVVLMETLARGRPAIATRIAAIPELIVDGHTGWLVAPGSATELADAMRRVLDLSTEELNQIGRRGRQRVLQQHDIRRSADILASLLPARARD